MTTQKSARDLLEGDYIVGHCPITTIATSPGVVYIWCEGTDPTGKADLIYSHGDPVKLEDKPQLKFVLEFEFDSDHPDVVNLVLDAIDKVAQSVTKNGLYLESPHDWWVDGRKIGHWGVELP